jgi:predicted permease
MAVTIVLLLVAVLFARSLRALAHENIGYDKDRVVVAWIDTRSSGYGVTDLPALHDRIIERLSRLPGVASASIAASGPFSGARNRGDFLAEGYTRTGTAAMVTLKDWVTPNYFRTVGLTVTRGRGFGPEDSISGRRVSVISESTAQRYFPNQNPVGKRVSWGSRNFTDDGFEVIGIVEDARYNDVRVEKLNMVYLPAAQADRFLGRVQVRATGDPTALVNAVRSALRESEPRLAVGIIDTLENRVAQSMGVDRLLSRLTVGFSAAALGLVCLGLYGTIAYAVRRRTAELGLRIALGAGRVAVQWLVVRDALILVIWGMVVGLPLALFAARAIGGMIYATSPFDLLSCTVVLGLLLVVCGASAYLPAWRASRLDPMAALRTE